MIVTRNGQSVAIHNARVRGMLPRLFQQRHDGSVLSIMGVGGTAATTITVVVPIVIAVIGFVLVTWVCPESTNIELWVERGPFGKDEDDRFCGHTLGDALPKAPDRTLVNKLAKESIDKDSAFYKEGPRLTLGSAVLEKSQEYKHNRHRYAIWCETPVEAYHALFDALFRPVIRGRESALNPQSNLIVLEILIPRRLEKSRLMVEFTRGDDSSNGKTTEVYEEGLPPELITEVRKPLTDLDHPTPHSYSLSFQSFASVTVTLKTRLLLYGDDSVVLPYEECYDGSTSTDAGGTRWLTYTKTFKGA
jgi:hypothetical protein